MRYILSGMNFFFNLITMTFYPIIKITITFYVIIITFHLIINSFISQLHLSLIIII